MEFQAVVMAAGMGSRMTDLTARTPKALLPVANKPMIWYPIQQLEKAGFQEAIIVVLESAQDDIRKTLVDICNVKLRLEFVVIPDDENWGTADTLRHIKDKIKTDVLVLSCDLITDLSLHLVADLHRTHDAAVTMLLSKTVESEVTAPGGKSNNKKVERDLIGLDEKGQRVLFLGSGADFEETVTFRKSLFKKHPRINMKTRLLDSHLYLMQKWILDFLDHDRSISTIKGELIPYLVKKQWSQPSSTSPHTTTDLPTDTALDTKSDIYSYAKVDELMSLAREMSTWNDHRGDMDDCYHGDKIRCYGYVMDKGFCLRTNTIASYCEANRQIPRLLGSLASDSEIPRIHPTAKLLSKSQVGPDCMVGGDATVGEKAGIKKSVTGSHCVIGDKVKITNSVIMDHVTVQEGSVIQNCIICENSHISEKCDLKDCIVGSSQNIRQMSKFSSEVVADQDSMMEI